MVAYATFNGLRLDMLFPVTPGHSQQASLISPYQQPAVVGSIPTTGSKTRRNFKIPAGFIIFLILLH
ncbi:MAG: hypothetical protein HFF45_03770 [Lawsonibacter sp.]|nr:hypothetical protein [Lawsonibacter sp.]